MGCHGNVPFYSSWVYVAWKSVICSLQAGSHQSEPSGVLLNNYLSVKNGNLLINIHVTTIRLF